MNFYSIYEHYASVNIEKKMHDVDQRDILRAIEGTEYDDAQLSALLSPHAMPHLEAMARKAQLLTVQHFGKTIQLYTPLYVSNICVNQCAYCGFNETNVIERKKLTLDEVEKEARSISETGMRHILLLTGESRVDTPVEYIRDCIKILKKYFFSIGIEIYALTEDEYKKLIDAGTDSLTIYQEVYDRDVYDAVHTKGPKKDYFFRLEASDRAARQGIHFVNIGVLLGLNDWRKEVFCLALHAQYLQNVFPSLEVSISLPRMQKHEGCFDVPYVVEDKHIVQAIIALRIFLPRVGITISTREGAVFREHILPLGVTRISAGSTTAVGGHTISDVNNPVQFHIADERNVCEIKNMLQKKGYQPVFKDWVGS